MPSSEGGTGDGSPGQTVAIVQARMGSTRLPGKVVLDLAGEPMLARVVERARRARRLDDVWVATTDRPADDRVAELCHRRGWPCFRGSEDDVLDRYHRTAAEARADRIVRITSDCPLVDPDVVDAVVEALGADPRTAYASNTVPTRTFPRGLDVEAFTADALGEAWADATEHPDREHVTRFIWRQPERFPRALVTAGGDWSAHRWTVDTPEDYELLARIWQAFPNGSFGWRDVLGLLERYPEWTRLNADIRQKPV